MIEAIGEAKIETEPFPYIYAENVFKDFDYEMLLARVPLDVEGTKYKPRRVMDFDAGLDLVSAIALKFDKEGSFRDETRLVLDRKGYGIWPHTDHKDKAASLLFYLPTDNSEEELGTSVYTPKDKEFRCAGGGAHKEEGFNKVWTAPFRRNSLFGFWKTDNSFHGVEKINRPITRNVLLYNVYHA